MSDIVERLRGIYRVPITDGFGKVDGNLEPDNTNEFVRQFPSPPIQIEAADEITRLRTALSEAEQRARREALEEAAKTIEEGFDRGIVSKHDLCAHKKFEWEDCESCAANAVRALIPSEPHDAEGRE